MNAIIKFLKDWTLPSAIGCGAVVYLIFASIPALDGFATEASRVFDTLLPLLLFAVLFIAFLKIDFHNLRPAAWQVWTCLIQVVLTLLMMCHLLYFQLSGDAQLLMQCALACVICPCASAASVVVVKLGGNLESIATFTLISNLLAAITIPIIFPLISSGNAEIPFFEAFLFILWKVFVVLVIPMAMAGVVRHFLPRFCQFLVSIPDLSFYIWSCTLAIVTGITVRNILNASTSLSLLVAIAIVSLVVCVVQFALGRHVGHFFKPCRITEAGQGLGQKNTVFAIWVSSTYLNPLTAVGPGCYIIWQNIVNSLELWRHRRHQ